MADFEERLGRLAERQAMHPPTKPAATRTVEADLCQSLLVYDFCKLIPSSAGNGTSHVLDEQLEP